MLGEQGKPPRIRAGDPPFPTGHRVGGRPQRLRKLFLAFPAGNAQPGDHPARLFRVERPLKGFLRGFFPAEKFLYGNAERRRQRGKLGDIRLRNAAFPFGDRLRMHAHPVGEFRLRQPRRLSQFFQPFLNPHCFSFSRIFLYFITKRAFWQDFSEKRRIKSYPQFFSIPIFLSPPSRSARHLPSHLRFVKFFRRKNLTRGLRKDLYRTDTGGAPRCG